MTNPCVLVVEDEPLIRIDMADAFEMAGYDVLEAGNAREAINHLEEHDDIRLIVTDVDMPGAMNGLELARKVFRGWPPIKIIVVSGIRRAASSEMPEGALFFSKPVDRDELLSSARTLLS